jgi:hypothetical protein
MYSRHAASRPSCGAREPQSSEPIFWQAFPRPRLPSLVSADDATWQRRFEVRSARRRAKRRCRPAVALFQDCTGRHNCLISIRRVPLRSISRIATQPLARVSEPNSHYLTCLNRSPANAYSLWLRTIALLRGRLMITAPRAPDGRLTIIALRRPRTTIARRR